MAKAPSRTPTLGAVIQAGLDRTANNLGVAMGGTVIEYDDVSRTATVQPGVYRLVPLYEDEDKDGIEEIPAIFDVPVMFPIGRGFAVNSSLEPGDPVLLVCLDRDNNGWLETGQPSPPDDIRLHHWSNAVAIPGLMPRLNPLSDQDLATSVAKANAVAEAIIDLRTQINALAAAIPTTPPYGPGDLIEENLEAEIGSDIIGIDS